MGSVARFECLVDGNPKPLVFWSKEGTQVLVFAGETYAKYTVDNEGTLTINNVEKEDKGFYVCSTISRVGSGTSRAQLSVLLPADIPPPIIRYGPADQILPEQTIAFLPCEASAPDTSIQWFYKGTQIENDFKYTITSKALQIESELFSKNHSLIPQRK